MVLAPQGPLLVVAGAGSGKTRMLTHRAAWAAVAWELPPECVLAVSFTRKTVDEMRERLRSLVGHEGAGLMICLTFHSAAWRVCVRPYRHEMRVAWAVDFEHVRPRRRTCASAVCEAARIAGNVRCAPG